MEPGQNPSHSTLLFYVMCCPVESKVVLRLTEEDKRLQRVFVLAKVVPIGFGA
jgi:hypothetical protein